MNWRPIKTAPKNQLILLSYSTGEKSFVHEGRWVEVLHTNHAMDIIQKQGDPKSVKQDPHWEISYVAIMDHGGAWNGKTFQERGMRVSPTHWQPLPKPFQRR